VGGAAQVTGQLPPPPLFFGCWRSSAELCPTEPGQPAGQGAGNLPEEISDAGAPQGNFPAPQAPEFREGLDGPERVRLQSLEDSNQKTTG
jgi:hypothetical protein